MYRYYDGGSTVSGFTDALAGGIGTLLRTFLQSANFVAGISGWRISKNGDAEFNTIFARGDLIAVSNFLTPPLQEAAVTSGALNSSTGTAALMLLANNNLGQATQLLMYADPATAGNVVLRALFIDTPYAELAFTSDFAGNTAIVSTVPLKQTYAVGGTEKYVAGGLLNRVQSSTASATTAGTEVKDTNVGDTSFTAVSGRTYRVVYNARSQSDTANDGVDLRIRGNNSSTSPTNTSNQLAGNRVQVGPTAGAAGGDQRECTHVLECPLDIATGLWTIAAFYVRSSGLGNVSVSQTAGDTRELYILDLGSAT